MTISTMLSKTSYFAIIAGDAKDEISSRLEKLGIKVYFSAKSESVDSKISYHSDVQLHKLDENNIIVAPELFSYYNNLLKDEEINIICGEKRLGLKYPEDVPYNVARFGKFAIHHFSYTDPKLIMELEKRGVEFIEVKQGYSACSIAVVGDNAVITDDPSIYKTLNKCAINVLLIEKGDISLPGHKYGFIGGACGYIDGKLFVTGSLSSHVNWEMIKKFCDNQGTEIVDLSKDKAIDLGSMFIFRKEG